MVNVWPLCELSYGSMLCERAPFQITFALSPLPMTEGGQIGSRIRKDKIVSCAECRRCVYQLVIFSSTNDFLQTQIASIRGYTGISVLSHCCPYPCRKCDRIFPCSSWLVASPSASQP